MPDNYKIGGFTFLDLRGAPQTSPAKIDIVTQPGRDGATAWHMARPNERPFQMQSIAAIADAAAGKELYQQYVQSVGFVASVLTWQGSDAYAGVEADSPLPALEPTKAMVLDVQMVSCKGVKVPVGFTGEGILVCVWTLLPWIVEEEA